MEKDSSSERMYGICAKGQRRHAEEGINTRGPTHEYSARFSVSGCLLLCRA